MPDPQPHPPHQPTRHLRRTRPRGAGDPRRAVPRPPARAGGCWHGESSVGPRHQRRTGCRTRGRTRRRQPPRPGRSPVPSGRYRPDANTRAPTGGHTPGARRRPGPDRAELTLAEPGQGLGAGQPTSQPHPVHQHREVVSVPVGEEPVLDHRERLGVSRPDGHASPGLGLQHAHKDVRQPLPRGEGSWSGSD